MVDPCKDLSYQLDLFSSHRHKIQISECSHDHNFTYLYSHIVKNL